MSVPVLTQHGLPLIASCTEYIITCMPAHTNTCTHKEKGTSVCLLNETLYQCTSLNMRTDPVFISCKSKVNLKNTTSHISVETMIEGFIISDVFVTLTIVKLAV